MTRFNFGTPNPVPCRLSDYPGLTVRVRVAGSINAGTDDEARGQQLKMMCLTLLNETLAGYGDKLSKDDFEKLTPELDRTLSDKLTARSEINCEVRIVSLSFDDQTQKMIDHMDLAKKMSDPEYAAKKLAEAEQAAREALERQKQENALNGQSINGDCVPPLGIGPGEMPFGMMPDTVDIGDIKSITPAAPAMPDYDAQWDKIRESIPPIPQPVTGIMANNRPKFCRNCGKPLPETGNFCGECGQPIM